MSGTSSRNSWSVDSQSQSSDELLALEWPLELPLEAPLDGALDVALDLEGALEGALRRCIVCVSRVELDVCLASMDPLDVCLESALVTACLLGGGLDGAREWALL